MGSKSMGRNLMLDKQDLVLLLALINKEQAEEIIDGILIESGVSTRLVNLKQLEMKLIKMKGVKFDE
jgi:hypothetical protein